MGGSMSEIKLICGDCKEELKNLDSGCIDLTVTSPPYDNLRSYNGFTFDFEEIAKELFRVTAKGGVVVWVVGDATINGSETGTSFKQALCFKEIGFNLHDTMFWYKPNPTPTDWKCYRYYNAVEYMFVFSKGKPKTCNYIRVPSKTAGKLFGTAPQRRIDGSKRDDRTEKLKTTVVNDFKVKSNMWEYPIGSGVSSDKEAHQHPAIFPEQLAKDHIISWSNKSDTILDPMMGSGTVGKMAKANNRNFIGIEISSDYCKIAEQRILNAQESLFKCTTSQSSHTR
jgi:site-specific DNA-methyltransferase (adenine-specific)